MEREPSNRQLHTANRARNDEFYTQLPDIEKELKHYKDQFRGKVVYCNCDDPFESNFFKYFAGNFNALGLKRLIATSYKPSPIANTQISLPDQNESKGTQKGRPKVTANKFIINEVHDVDGDGAFDLDDIAEQLKANKNNEWSALLDDDAGDFRSDESIELLKQADIVVTNPPFSLFREYLKQLVEFDKKFLIIGNTNAITYKEVFELFKRDKIRTGYTNFNIGMFFTVPADWEKFHHIDDKGNKLVRVSTSCWFTNLEVTKHKEDVTLYKKYTPEEYPKYDNYDAINVNKYTDIPLDYAGHIGVPITFVDKYNPEQFEIIKFRKGDDEKDLSINGKYTYFRIIVRNKKVKK